MEIEGLIAIIGFFSSIVLIIYYFFSTRHKERIALIEHDKHADIFSGESNRRNALKYGVVAIGIGLGLFLGHWVTIIFNIPEPLGYITFMFILGGIALLIYYFIVRDDH